jgi:hypothetical protein
VTGVGSSPGCAAWLAGVAIACGSRPEPARRPERPAAARERAPDGARPASPFGDGELVSWTLELATDAPAIDPLRSAAHAYGCRTDVTRDGARAVMVATCGDGALGVIQEGRTVVIACRGEEMTEPECRAFAGRVLDAGKASVSGGRDATAGAEPAISRQPGDGAPRVGWTVDLGDTAPVVPYLRRQIEKIGCTVSATGDDAFRARCSEGEVSVDQRGAKLTVRCDAMPEARCKEVLRRVLEEE